MVGFSLEEQEDSDTADFQSLEIPTIQMITISLNTFPVNFKIDTGADVSVISDKL